MLVRHQNLATMHSISKPKACMLHIYHGLECYHRSPAEKG